MSSRADDRPARMEGWRPPGPSSWREWRPSMRSLVALLGVALLASVAVAGQTLRELSWVQLHDAGRLLGGHVRPDGVLEIDPPDQAGAAVPILELESPGISRPVYAITGEVRCENVRGGGC